MTKREKLLVFIMVAVAMVALSVQFAIIPLYSGYAEKDDRLNDLEIQKMNADSRFAQEFGTRDAFNRALLATEDIRSSFPNEIPTEFVDQRITELCFANNVVPRSLSMTAPRGMSIPTFDSENTTDRYPPAYQSVTATMRLSGSYNQLLQLVGAVDQLADINLTRLRFEGDIAEMGDRTNISATFEIIMLSNIQEDMAELMKEAAEARDEEEES